MTEESDAPAPATTAPVPRRELNISLKDTGMWVITGLLFGVAAIAQLIGPHTLPLGPMSIVILPMIWALLMGVLISAQKIKPLPVDLQHTANALMAVAVLVLCARLSLTLGPNVPALIAAGPALLLQELGNVFGSILLALPLAVLLRMGPATVGATFSIDREPSFAMVTAKYGPDSPQYRGVLSMYIFGSIFGAIVVSFVASAASALGLFRWEALAMGSGVGSGSMMGAGIASVGASFPEFADQIAAYATTANMIAAVIGVPLTVWISLPLADKFYKFLTKRQQQPVIANNTATIATLTNALESPKVNLPLWSSLTVLSLGGLITASIAAKSFSFNMVMTYAILVVLVVIGIWAAKVTKGKLPALIVVILLGTYLTSPWFPGATWLLETAASVDYLSVITLMLAVAGLSIGKDLPLLKQIGWKILPVGFVVIAATFLASAVIAEVVLGMLGQ